MKKNEEKTFLYRYYFDEKKVKKTVIEVKETPQMYIGKNEPFKNCRWWKNRRNFGGLNGSVIMLLENDDEKALKMFLNRCEANQRRYADVLRKVTEKISYLKGLMEDLKNERGFENE